MKSIEELLRNLARPDVLEFGLVTNRLPSINVGGRFEPVDDEAPTTDRVKQMLVAMGGARFIEGLSDKPIQWTTQLEGVGVIAVAAIMRKDVVQARFTVARREASARIPITQHGPPRQKDPSGAIPIPVVGVRPGPGQPPAQGFRITQQGPGAPPPVAVLPKTDDGEDDDNEPTVQTLSPQNVSQPQPLVSADEPRPKPARRPEDVRSASSEAPASPTQAVEIVSKAGPAEVREEEPAESRPPAVTVGAVTQVVHSTVPSTAPAGVAIAVDEDQLREAHVDPEVPPKAGRPREAHVEVAAAFDSFLAMAVAAQATDLHLAGGRPVLLRIGGDLVARTQSLSSEHVGRIARDMLPPRLRETLDGEGSCDFAIDHAQHGRFRVNLSRYGGGTTIAVRVLGRECPSVRALGLPEAVACAARFAQGLVLVTGPAGHGKTTTLAALVDAINAEGRRHVCVIEDPIEHVHPKRRGLVTQREIGTHVRSWFCGIDEALASDVDVIVLGELRDEGAARAALVGCEAGRLVLATMSCTSAAKAIDRLVERFHASERERVRTTFASAIRLVVGQRLVPSADRTRLHLALETIPGTSALYSLVRDGRTHQIPALQQRARSAAYVRLDDSLAELVRAQRVTLDVAKQFAEAPADLARAKKG